MFLEGIPYISVQLQMRKNFQLTSKNITQTSCSEGKITNYK